MYALKLVNLKKSFGNTLITRGVNLEVPYGKMTVIIGRSGEGKSVLLKQAIGLLEPTEGSIFIDGIDISTLNEKDRDQKFKQFGYVFQFAALLDSLNVLENVGITLIEQGMDINAVIPIVKEKLRLVNLSEDNLYKYPSELSGGMKKRVGLARTLVTNPTIILYDEPTTGLDPITSRVIHDLMGRMQKELNLTSIIISHDVEIFKYADFVAFLHEGRIQYFGPAATIWESDNPYIYQFIRGLPNGPIRTEASTE